MPQKCCCFGCNNQRNKEKGIALHKFPLQYPEISKLWLHLISRENFQASEFSVVCSEHFLKGDYLGGVHPREETGSNLRHQLLLKAVPSVFKSHPLHKQISQTQKRRNPPKDRNLPVESPRTPPKKVCKENDHSYFEIPATQTDYERELHKTKVKLENTRKELKVVKQNVKRKSEKITNLLQKLTESNMLTKTEVDFLSMNFGENTFKLIENEVNQIDVKNHGARYSDEMKQFAVTIHYYSSQAYEFLRTYLHLPHVETIRRWSASLDCQPGILREVIGHISQMVKDKPELRHCCLMFDAMAIKKEVVYDPKLGKYAGFVDCGHFQPSSEDTLATEALVFMAVGLSSKWKFPVAYFLSDHLTGQTQAEILKILTTTLIQDAGLHIHGIICDGSYANQATASKLGCSTDPNRMVYKFSNPVYPEQEICFIFDACHLIKLVRNCLSSLGTIYNGTERISWEYIEHLYEIQQQDNLYIANKLKSKHIQWKQHKMNVKLAVQTLSSSVADAIDFLREDLRLPQFAGSENTTEFIRKMDRLFDFLNSKTPCGKGFKRPMNLTNYQSRKQQLLDIKDFISKLTDSSGILLCKGRRKTAWIGFMVTIESVLHITKSLLEMADPLPYVLTYKMSQDHLEMYFSRIRRRGGWNNNPNCLQFKWSLRANLMKNSILPSKNANVIMDEPIESVFSNASTQHLTPINSNMIKFAELLSHPSEFHDQILHYMAGYVIRNVLKECICAHCKNALQDESFTTPQDQLMLDDAAALTIRKDKGGLIHSTHDVYKIIKATDTVLRLTFSNQPFKSSNLLLKSVQNQVLGQLRGRIFLSLSDHFHEVGIFEDDHFCLLVNKISSLFVRTIMHHHGRLYTERFIMENKASRRHQLTKTVLFLGQ